MGKFIECGKILCSFSFTSSVSTCVEVSKIVNYNQCTQHNYKCIIRESIKFRKESNISFFSSKPCFEAANILDSNSTNKKQVF